jgi:hypothetical protein
MVEIGRVRVKAGNAPIEQKISAYIYAFVTARSADTVTRPACPFRAASGHSGRVGRRLSRVVTACEPLMRLGDRASELSRWNTELSLECAIESGFGIVPELRRRSNGAEACGADAPAHRRRPYPGRLQASRSAPAALDESFSGERPFEDAMGEYQRARDAQVGAMYEFTCQLATLEPAPPQLQQVLRAVHGNQAAMDGLRV